LSRFFSPKDQALNTTKYYVIAPHLPWTDTDYIATDYVYIPIPEIEISTAQTVRVHMLNDTGAADDSVLAGLLGISDDKGRAA
jgi:hypothetical protein